MPIVLQVLDAISRLMRYLAVGGSKRQPLARSAADEVLLFARQFGRSCGWVQRGIGIDRQTIVAGSRHNMKRFGILTKALCIRSERMIAPFVGRCVEHMSFFKRGDARYKRPFLARFAGRQLHREGAGLWSSRNDGSS